MKLKSASLKNAAKLASFNIIIQIALRICSFVANAILLRLISRDILGIINFRLMLLYTTSQLLSREATRRACISECKLYKWQTSINCIWYNLPISFAVSSLLSILWIKFLFEPIPELINAYQIAVVCMPLSVFLELLSEPFFIFAQLNGFVKLRVITEALMQVIRTIALLIVVYYFRDASITIINFGIIYVATSFLYSFIYLTFFWIFFKADNRTEHVTSLNQFLPSFSNNEPMERQQLLNIIWSFFKQTILKQFLTEGERFVVVFFNLLSFQDQGLYHVISNLGSLAARFIFAPIEEASYLYFSQNIDRNQLLNLNAAKQTQKIFCNLLKLMLLVGLIVFVFGFHFSPTLLLFYGGPSLTESVSISLMRWQCFYIAIIAINGVTETFTFSAMNKKQLSNFNYFMIVFSILFLLSAFLFVYFFKIIGFIFAVCVPMIARIIYSFSIIQYYFKSHKISNSLLSCIPSLKTFSCFMMTFLVLQIIKQSLTFSSITSHFIFIVFGIFLIFPLLCAIYTLEKDLVSFIKNELFKNKKE